MENLLNDTIKEASEQVENLRTENTRLESALKGAFAQNNALQDAVQIATTKLRDGARRLDTETRASLEARGKEGEARAHARRLGIRIRLIYFNTLLAEKSPAHIRKVYMSYMDPYNLNTGPTHTTPSSTSSSTGNRGAFRASESASTSLRTGGPTNILAFLESVSAYCARNTDFLESVSAYCARNADFLHRIHRIFDAFDAAHARAERTEARNAQLEHQLLTAQNTIVFLRQNDFEQQGRIQELERALAERRREQRTAWIEDAVRIVGWVLLGIYALAFWIDKGAVEAIGHVYKYLFCL
ncbi:hypothetical protein JR316_0012356 [Psilocybe cubensis]|uniref:Uncharacterized protein n=2 Tax=Psilocybe cubensis TaxID=181762 RepID=A0ACB8GIG6_PSICU|nr:hypothetical protein JR316_0012356 [Psilocybe cubensis]KAH9475245.1 hypothetical protein JR316_0012356 [Psilocybe cubensis]